MGAEPPWLARTRRLALTLAAMTQEAPRDYFRTCNICKKPIPYGAKFYRCSVSTCNSKRFPFHLCSLDCFSAHAPEARHRDAWAEEDRAPTREQEEKARAEAAAAASASEERRAARMVGVGAPPAGLASDAPRDVLVVVSKLKAYVKARGDMSTSDAVVDVLSDHLRNVCDQAIEKARVAGRKTVMDRDFDF